MSVSVVFVTLWSACVVAVTLSRWRAACSMSVSPVRDSLSLILWRSPGARSKAAFAIVPWRAALARLTLPEQSLVPRGQETGTATAPVALTRAEEAPKVIGDCGNACADPSVSTSERWVTATQKPLDGHDTDARPERLIFVGADQLVPSKMTELPLASTATQKPPDGHDTDVRPDTATMLAGAVQLAPLNITALPLPSTATQKPLDGHDSETIGLSASTGTGALQVRPSNVNTDPVPSTAAQKLLDGQEIAAGAEHVPSWFSEHDSEE